VRGQPWDLSPQPRRKSNGLDLGRDVCGGFAHRAEQVFVVRLFGGAGSGQARSLPVIPAPSTRARHRTNVG
jgi:hypothetical protein